MPWKYSPEQNEYIGKLYETSNGNRRKAQKLFKDKFGFKASITKIVSYWNNQGLISIVPSSQGGHRHGLNENDFRNLYSICNGDIAEMANKCGNNEAGLIARCKILELPVLNKTPYQRRIV